MATTTREERLGWTPEQALEIARGADGSATAALAMYEQLERAGVALESLELCIVYWSRALDGLDPGPVPPERLDRLERDLQLELHGSPVLARWMAALRWTIDDAVDLDRVIQLLMLARTSWATTRWMRARGLDAAPAPDAFPVGAQLAGGRYVIRDWIRGEPARGMGRALNRLGTERFLVTMGTKQSRPIEQRQRELALDIDGVARLRHIGPVAGHEEELDAMVEDEPAGRPSAELALPLAPQTTVELALELAGVLERAHSAGQVLRHLRPELIYVVERASVRLSAIAPRADLFLSGVTTPCYGVPALFHAPFAAPEVMAMREPATPAADVFSLCAVLCVWLTGEHPFAGDTPMAQIDAMVRNQGRPWRGPMKLGIALGPGLDPDPARRPSLERITRNLCAAL